MTSNLLLWLVVGPALVGLLVFLITLGLGRQRWLVTIVSPLAPLASLALAGLGLRSSPLTTTIAMHGDGVGVQLLLALNHGVGVELVGAALLLLAIYLLSGDFVRDSRQGPIFFFLLLVAQSATNEVLLAGDLLALYAGLLLLSLSLMLLIGLDFALAGGNAALRVFATLEVPSAVALASISVIAARAGAGTFSDLTSQTYWIWHASSLALILPILVALISRAGLLPLQHWVVVGCRAAAAPVAVVIAGIAVPLGGLVLGRVVGATPLDPIWLHTLAILGVATALIAALATVWEGTALGWLGYVAVAQVGLATVGFAEGSPLGDLAGWLTLAGAALAGTLAGLGLAVTIRATHDNRIGRSEHRPARLAVYLPAGIGVLALAPLPPFLTFSARRILLASLVTDGSRLGMLLTVGVVLATVLLTIGVGRMIWSEIRVVGVAEPPPERPRSKRRGPDGRRIGTDENVGWQTIGALTLLGILTVLVGVIPLTWLAQLTDLTTVSIMPTASPLAETVAALLLAVATIVALAWLALAKRLADRPRRASAWSGYVAWLGQRLRLDLASDPYVVIGGLLLALGRLSAGLLDHTLGRLVRVH